MEGFLVIASFVVVVALTPGPNNLILAMVGMRFGAKAAIPHLIGIKLGMASLLFLSVLGFGHLIEQEPVVLLVIRIFGSGYLIYLSWKIFGVDISTGHGAAIPLTIWRAFLFQFSNPKAWMMAPTALGIGLSTFPSMSQAILALLVTFWTVGLASNLVWVFAGSQMKSLYRQPIYRRGINFLLAALTLLTVVWFWLPLNQ